MVKKVASHFCSRQRLTHLDGLSDATSVDREDLPEYSPVSEEQGEIVENMGTELAIVPPRYSSLSGSLPIPDRISIPVKLPDTPVSHRPFIRRSGHHKYSITSGHGIYCKPWATLKVIGKDPDASTAEVCGGQNISGLVEIDLETARTIYSITLTLRGVIATTSFQDDSYTFMNHNITIWTRQDGHPTRTVPLSSFNNSHPECRIAPFVTFSSKAAASEILPYIFTPFVHPSPSTPTVFLNPASYTLPPNSTLLAAGKSNGRLLGRYEWPFSFPFPTEIEVSERTSGGSAARMPAPQSIQGHGTNVTIKYYLTLNISHGKFHKASQVHAPIIYVPAIKPEAVSPLFQAAYLAHEAPPGPLVDNLGWKDLPQVSIHRRVFRNRVSHVTCTLSLANPQCYARGTTIPCFLKMSTTNFGALQSLVPRQLHARLMRLIKHPKKPGLQMCTGNQEIIKHSLEISRAVWCLLPIESNYQGQYTRYAQGEIHLDRQLQPSCSTPFFSVCYTVELFAFDPELQTETELTKVLLAHEVLIATQLSQGPKPVALTSSSLWTTANASSNNTQIILGESQVNRSSYRSFLDF